MKFSKYRRRKKNKIRKQSEHSHQLAHIFLTNLSNANRAKNPAPKFKCTNAAFNRACIRVRKSDYRFFECESWTSSRLKTEFFINPHFRLSNVTKGRREKSAKSEKSPKRRPARKARRRKKRILHLIVLLKWAYLWNQYHFFPKNDVVTRPFNKSFFIVIIWGNGIEWNYKDIPKDTSKRFV